MLASANVLLVAGETQAAGKSQVIVDVVVSLTKEGVRLRFNGIALNIEPFKLFAEAESLLDEGEGRVSDEYLIGGIFFVIKSSQEEIEVAIKLRRDAEFLGELFGVGDVSTT